MTCNLNPHILRYLEMVENGEIEACIEQHELAAHVRKCFETEDIYTDDELLEKYLGLSKYFPFERLFEWEAFCIALHLCTFWRDSGKPRWDDLFLLLGRGAGKDGYISFASFCVISPYSKLSRYDVDICAISEETAMRPVNDLYDVLENPHFRAKLSRFFGWTKEMVFGRKYRGVVRGRTSNPKTKVGMRSGMVVFNEKHQYENYRNIKVFVSGLGKKKHPRRLSATTNGDVRDGPLDDDIAKAERILKKKEPDGGFLPFICRLDNKDEVHDKKNWQKANPSLPYLPDLMGEIEKEYEDWKSNPSANQDLMTMRMNLPQSDAEIVVTDWENIKATSVTKDGEPRELPDLTGWACTVGIDYASMANMASLIFHFRKGNERFDIHHSWLCKRSKDLHRLKCPWQDWADAKHITVVDDVEIHPDLLCEYILLTAQKYQIRMLALDNYRFALMAASLRKIGFDMDIHKNIKLVRPSDVMKVEPVIESVFNNQNFIWGDCPPLRWATNNTKRVRSGRKEGTDTGNFYYAKIDAKSRYNDPFMALVAAMTVEDELGTGENETADLPVIVA